MLNTAKNYYHLGGNSSWQVVVVEASLPPGGNGRGLSTARYGLWPTLVIHCGSDRKDFHRNKNSHHSGTKVVSRLQFCDSDAVACREFQACCH
jgi:hypothetical protein